MPLVLINKARRVAAEARPRPTIVRPPEELAAAYAVANRHVPALKVALATAARAALPKELRPELVTRAIIASTAYEARRRQNGLLSIRQRAQPAEVEPVVMAVPGLDLLRLEPAYLAVLLDAQGTGRVALQKKAAIPKVKVNPASVDWARTRGSKLITDISESTRKVVRNVVARGLERGQRAESMAAAIQRAIGLSERDEAAVDRRREQLTGQGLDEGKADALSDQYADQLLEQRAIRIARTETVAAQNRGLLDGWREARDAGDLPVKVKRYWISAPPSPNPNRPCVVCVELDGQEVGLDEPYHSEELDEDLESAPAHPSCRCTQGLKAADGDAEDAGVETEGPDPEEQAPEEDEP
jgi:hypothetical protein